MAAAEVHYDVSVQVSDPYQEIFTRVLGDVKLWEGNEQSLEDRSILRKSPFPFTVTWRDWSKNQACLQCYHIPFHKNSFFIKTLKYWLDCQDYNQKVL